mgnify:CR=1 FL=1
MGALALLMTFILLRIIAFVAARPEQFPDEGYGTVLLLLFVLLLLRSAGTTQRHALRARRVDLHLAQPVRPRSVMLGQFGAVVLSALSYHDYEGIALNEDEKPRLVADLGDNNFFMLRNHGLLTVNDHPQWYTVSGGSRSYVETLVNDLAGKRRSQ